MADYRGMTAPERISDTLGSPALSPILIIDDSRAQRRLLSRTLENWGYETVEAASGEEALQLCQATSFDVIISDWMMPGGMSGVDFCRSFRAYSERPSFIILLTAQTEREVLAEGLESGADDFLSKPFHAVELRARLRAGHRSVQAQRALADKNQELSSTLEDLSDAYAAIERDLKGARVFQEGLLPKRKFVDGRTEVSLLFQASGHVGGDLVGYFPIRDGEIGVFSVDVSGHGVASALMTARIAGYFSDASPDRNLALTRVGSSYQMADLPHICSRLNYILMQDAESDQYLTMSIARVESATGRVELCQAGHPSPIVQRSDGTMEFLELWSTPIGLVEVGEYATAEIVLNEGDRLLMYSDGITECPDANGNLLDEAGLQQILRGSADLSGSDWMSELLRQLKMYRDDGDFPDDVSAVSIEFR